MAIPYTQTTMANVRAVDGTYISYPFLEDGDTSTKVYNMICTQRESDYSTSQIDLDDPMTNATTAGVIELPFPSDSSAYFVGDTGHSSIGGGMLQFTRTFSNIPQTTTTPSSSSFVTFPGIGDGNMGITALSMTLGTDGIFITTATPHSFSVDDRAYFTNVSYTYDNGTDPSETNSFGDPDDPGYTSTVTVGGSVFVYSEVLEVVSTTKFRINPPDLAAWTETATLTPLTGEIWNREKVELTIDSIAMNTGGAGINITTTTAHSLSVGEYVNIVMRFTVGSDPFMNSVSGRFEILSLDGTDGFIVDVGMYWNTTETLTVQTGRRIIDVGNLRNPLSLNVVTTTRYNYILPGVTSGISDSTDIAVPPVFQVVDQNTGAVMDTTQDSKVTSSNNGYFFTYPTIPSSTEYTSMMTDKANIVIESSLSTWAGNILVLKTKTCQAK